MSGLAGWRCGGTDPRVPCPAADSRHGWLRSDSQCEGGHQLAVLHRHVARPRYRPGDRMVLATLAKLLPRERWPIFLVTPSTLLRWHRELIRRRWTYPATGSRRRLDPAVVELVQRLARDNDAGD